MRPLQKLLLAALLVGCGSPIQQTTSTEVTTHFLYYQHGGGTDPTGGMGGLFVEAGPNPNYRAPVRFAETESGGVGDGWRATVWMSLLSASTVLERDPLGLRITVEADDAVDGPSAGGLMTVAIVAAVRGEPLDPTATMTGTINPDLTLGPVGGIPEKVQAAIDGGKTRIGVPVGQGQALSIRTRQSVDVVALGRQHGVEVRLLKDIRDAYELMTGQQLEPQEMLPADALTLPSWVADVFKEHANKIVEQVEQAQEALNEIFQRSPYPAFAQQRQALFAEIARCKQLIQTDQSVLAIYAATGLQGWHFSLTTALLSRVGVELGRWEYVGNVLRTLQQTVTSTLDTSMPNWKSYDAHLPIEVPYVVDTFEALIHALRGLTEAQQLLTQNAPLRRLLQDSRYRPRSDQEVRAIQSGIEPFANVMLNAHGNLLLGHAYFDVGQAWLQSHPERGSNALSDSTLQHVASQYERVADANLQYMDTLFVQTIAAQRQESPELTRRRLMQFDADYRQAVMNRQLPQRLSKDILTPRERIYALLSGAVSSYFSSATVISKRYSLGAVFNAKRGNEIVGFRHAEAFESMSELAHRQARGTAATCRARLGEIPIPVLIEYELGRQLDVEGRRLVAQNQNGGLQVRLEAMTHMWRAYTLGRLALSTDRHVTETGGR